MDELYDSMTMPLSEDSKRREAEEKFLKGEKLTSSDLLKLGRDHTVKEIDGYHLKSNCCYRAISFELYNIYLANGFVFSEILEDEYEEYEEDGVVYNNNRGVDWYLGGVAPHYGEVILECPAYKTYFVPANDFGTHMSFDPTVRHMKSSGRKNPIPMDLIRVIRCPNRNLKDESLKR